MKQIAIIAAMLLLGAARAGAQVDSCIAYFDTIPTYAEGPPPGFHGEGHLWQVNHNPDSVRVDTCSTSATYGNLFISRWVEVTFDSDQLQIPADSVDSIVETTWETIDTNYPAVRSGFSAIETKYGSFALRKLYPESGIGGPGSAIFLARFSSYVCLDSVLNDMTAIPLIGVWPDEGLVSIPEGVVRDAISETPNNISLFPNPAQTSLTIRRLDSQPIRHVELFDMLGKSVFKREYQGPNEVTIDLHAISSGSYFLVCDYSLTENVTITR